MKAERIQKVLDYLDKKGYTYDYYEHPEAPTIAIAKEHWKQDGSKHCKNLFFRNHKGNRHYLVVLDCEQDLDIHDLEHRLHQGKLSFASPTRMEKYLGLSPGSVSPFGLINDTENHVKFFNSVIKVLWMNINSSLVSFYIAFKSSLNIFN